MDKVLEDMIGKQCSITTLKSYFVGEIKAVESGILTLKTKQLEQFIAIKYIISVNQVPDRTQNKKSFSIF
ncbi:DUF6897 domain-containing protein [Holzapfeliella sp. JNUCC 80]